MINKNSNAFSLVELLVVVSIIGILASIAVAGYQKYRTTAYEVSAKTDLRNLRTAQEAYRIDHEVYASCNNATECANIFPAIDKFSPFVGVSTASDDAAPNVYGPGSLGGPIYSARTCSTKSIADSAGQADSFFFFYANSNLTKVKHNASNCVSMAQ